MYPHSRRPRPNWPRRSATSTSSTRRSGIPHFALEVLRVLGQNGIYVLTGVPGVQSFIQTDPAGLMRQMVLRNQILLGTVNAGADAFAAAIQDLQEFKRRWPQPAQALIGGRYPAEQATELTFGRPAGIKTVISFISFDDPD